MFVMYILFFLAILLALCRDSVSMYAAAAVLLVVFVIGCSLIQSYAVEVKGLLVLKEDDGNSTTGRYKREMLPQVIQPEVLWKPQEPSVPWQSLGDRFPMYPANPQPVPMEAAPRLAPEQPPFDFQPVPNLPPQPGMPTLTVPEVPTVPESETMPTFRNVDLDPDDSRWGERAATPSPKKKKYFWKNELRWASNVLGVLHVLLLADVICILYEMLFGGRYRYRTWC